VDGTLTDGGVALDGSGGEWKRFDIQDGMGIVRLQRTGVEVALISGRRSEATVLRARELGIREVVNGIGDKLPALQALCRSRGTLQEETCFVGDDVNDIDCIRWSGLGVAVRNARLEVKAAADWITPSCGGYGAVRDVAERILALNGGPHAPQGV
jgi:3-deoxy-D-manno-octulosonate 8-phosphate phosphatase (KDO 8-P phosphatase)